MKSQNIQYVPALDHLRGFAALLVLFYHGVFGIYHDLTTVPPVLAYTDEMLPKADFFLSAFVYEGHSGVALFMVLSGFIFTIGTHGHDISYWQFIRNRFLRTYPLFLFMLFIGVYANPASFDFSGLLQSIFFFANMPGSAIGGAFTNVHWAVAVEWQFYLIFPFLIYFVRQQGLRVVFGMIFLLIIMRSLIYLEELSVRELTYMTIVGRLDQFLIGICIGVYYLKRFKKDLMHDCLFVASLALVAAALYLFNLNGGLLTDQYSKVWWPTIEGGMWAAFILGYLSFSRWVPKLVSAVLIKLGVISYSVYLLHFVLVDITIKQGWLVDVGPDNIIGSAYATSVLVILPLSLAVSIMTYHFIEKPFLKLRGVYRQPIK